MEKRLGLITLIVFVLSIICGIFIPQFADDVAFAGIIYMNLLKLIIIPVLFFNISSAVANYKNHGIKKMTTKMIVIFLSMYIFSFLWCMLLWGVIKPGVGFSIIDAPLTQDIIYSSLDQFLISLFPPNVLEPILSNNLLPIIIISFAIGFGLSRTRPYGSNSFNNLNKVVKNVLYYILYLTPFGVFSLMYGAVAKYGNKVFSTALTYVIAAYAGCIIVTIFTMIIPVWVYAGINPIKYIKKIRKPLYMAFTTCSSSATVPLTVKTCNEEFGISEKITNLIIPFGSTVHMCGCAVSFSLLAVFNIQMLGMPISIGSFLIILFVALLLTIGAPGISGGGIVIDISLLSILGIPLSFIGLYAGIYRALDAGYTTVNVLGDITANILLGYKKNKKKVQQ